MKKVSNIIGIVILAFVIVALCAWRATTNHLTYCFPMDYIGILGFGVTLLTAWFAFFIRQDVKQLTNKYSLKLALPESQNCVEIIRQNLARFLRSKVDFTKVNVVILEIVANCLSECENHRQKNLCPRYGIFNPQRDCVSL
jgi:hypothetical protein